MAFLIGRDEGLWSELARIRKVTLPLVITTFILLRLQNEILTTDMSVWQNQASMFIIYLNRWLWIVMVLGWGHHYLNRPFKWLPYATEAVYPWYILHQTITVVAGYQLSKLALGPVIEPILVLGVTIGGCLALHEFVIRRTPILRPLFGLSYRPRAVATAKLTVPASA